MENVRNSTALLADLIVHGKPARIAFKSKEQFLALLGTRFSESSCAGEIPASPAHGRSGVGRRSRRLREFESVCCLK
jgi:hypothetical protein